MDWLEAQVSSGNCWFWDYSGEAHWHREYSVPYNKRAPSCARRVIDLAMELQDGS